MQLTAQHRISQWKNTYNNKATLFLIYIPRREAGFISRNLVKLSFFGVSVYRIPRCKPSLYEGIVVLGSRNSNDFDERIAIGSVPP